jgi:hypothetical protein
MKRLPDDPRFKHVDYKHTNLRVTFARIRKQQADEAAATAAAQKVITLQRKTK